MPGRLPDAVQQRLDLLSNGLQGHIKRVRALAGDLAALHGVDRHLVDLSAASHDLARAMTDAELLREARKLGIEIGEVEEIAPILLHGPVAAGWLVGLGVQEQRVLEAVRRHTTGTRGMDVVGRVVFLADKLEPQKVAGRQDLGPLVILARESLDEALRQLIDLSLVYHIRKGHPVSPETLDMRNSLLHVPVRGA